MPGHVLEVSHRELCCDACLLRATNDRLGQWVLGISLDSRHKRKDFLLRQSIGRKLGDFGFALGQRSGLVHYDNLDSSCRFDCSRVLEQNPSPGA